MLQFGEVSPKVQKLEQRCTQQRSNNVPGVSEPSPTMCPGVSTKRRGRYGSIYRFPLRLGPTDRARWVEGGRT